MLEHSRRAAVLVHRASAALLAALAALLIGIGVSALSKLTNDHLDADRTQVTVLGMLALLASAAPLVAAVALVRSSSPKNRTAASPSPAGGTSRRSARRVR